jgi:hypothetical protein
MQLKFGRAGAIVSGLFTFLVGAGVFYFAAKMYSDFNFFPDLVLFLLLIIGGYFTLKPSLLSFFVLTFSKGHQLTITRPIYKVNLFANSFINFSIDLKEVEKLIIVKPERPSAPFNYLFFMKGNTGKASLVLYFDEKEGVLVKRQLKKSNLKAEHAEMSEVNFDSFLGVSTLY